MSKGASGGGLDKETIAILDARIQHWSEILVPNIAPALRARNVPQYMLLQTVRIFWPMKIYH